MYGENGTGRFIMNKNILSLLFCLVVLLLISGCAEEKASIPEKNIAPESGKELVEQIETQKQDKIQETSLTLPQCSSQQIETCNEKCKEFGTSYSPENEACFKEAILYSGHGRLPLKQCRTHEHF